ncbi:hypothetical protein ACFCYM_18240, partial [Streptomyces sp. NPDC056254]
EGMDLAKLFPGRRGLNIEQAPYKGSGFLGTPESPAALFKSWRIKPAQIRDIVLATSDRHPRLDDVSAKAAGPDYARRWDAARTAWINDHTPDDTDTTSGTAPAAAPAGGLNLSAHRQTPATASDEERLAEAFRAQIDAQFATAPDPDPKTESTPAPKAAPGGLNLSALRGEQDNAARQAALAALEAAGPEGTGASAIARALTDAHGTNRQTISGWLQEWADEGLAVRIGTGTKTRYVHHSHSTEAPGA